MTAQRIEIGLDAANNIVGWRQRIVNEFLLRAHLPPDLLPRIQARTSSPAAAANSATRCPTHQVEWVRAPRGVDVGAWRGIAAGYTKFAIETMIDEIAALKGIDPLAFRLDAARRAIRAPRPCCKTVGRRWPNWGKKRPGRALGIAYSDALHSHTAGVAEVSVDDKHGRYHGAPCLGRGRCRYRGAAEEHRRADRRAP